MLAGEAVIFGVCRFTGISFLWYNVLGLLVVVFIGLTVSAVTRPPRLRSETDA